MEMAELAKKGTVAMASLLCKGPIVANPDGTFFALTNKGEQQARMSLKRLSLENQVLFYLLITDMQPETYPCSVSTMIERMKRYFRGAKRMRL